MKKLLFTTLILLAYAISGLAQTTYYPLVHEGDEQQWNVLYVTEPYHYTWETEIQFIEGDSIIDGVAYKQAWRKSSDGTGLRIKGFVREENKRVYSRILSYYNGEYVLGEEVLLYDFNLTEGDTVTVGENNETLMVIEESEVEVDGTMRRQLGLGYEPWPLGSVYEYWIEGVGSTYGFLNSGSESLCGSSSHLLCYYENNGLIWDNEEFDECVMNNNNPYCWDGTVAEAYSGGDGTEENPYQIITAEQLALLAEQTDNGTGGDAYYILTRDICLGSISQTPWKPIGRYSTGQTSRPFTGVFDGNGHKIENIIINDTYDDDAMGLFGYTDGAEIVNVNLSDCRLTGGEYAGGLVGYAGSTDIFNCSVQNSQIITTGGVAGGIVGHAGMPFGIHETNENVSKITNCEINRVTVESAVDAGGIVGKVNDDLFYARYLVSNCGAHNEQYYHVKGSVSGGIVGEMRYGIVEGCASQTIVVGTGQVSNVCVGGIAGSIHGSSVIANSYNRGNVVADFEFAGGIVGYSAGSLYNVYNAGEIYMPDPNSSGYGTIVGNVQDGTYLNCYWLENEIPAAGNYYMPEMIGSTSFHEGATPKTWVLNEAQYGTTDLLEALNLGPHDNYLWLEDTNNTNDGYPICVDIEPSLPIFGSEWYYEILNDDGSITYQYLQHSGDTTINDEPVQIIVKINTLYDKGKHVEKSHEYIYERDDKVYWWNKTLEEFTVLYDYNAQVGDEWEINVGLESLLMHVDAVELYEYEGRQYKMLQVSDAENLFSGTIVRGIGHLTSFFPERLLSKGYRVEGIRCFWQAGELVFKYGEKECDEVYEEFHDYSVDDLNGSEEFSIFPNPTDGMITISGRQTGEYRITNLMGQTLMTGQIESENQQINISALSDGMFFITFAGSIRKFIKH